MDATVQQQLDLLRDWLQERHPECGEIGPETDLLEDVLGDSLEFIAFLVFVEDVRGVAIAAEDVDREAFRSLDTLRERYLTTAVHAE